MEQFQSVRNLLIIANYQKPDAQDLAEKIERYVRDRGIECDIFGFSGPSEISCAQKYDLALTLGGDGTVLFAARTLGPLGIPILPVNLGNFGFITETGVDELFSDLDKALGGKLKVGKRLMLEFCLSRGEEDTGCEDIFHGIGLNDVVFAGTGISKLVHLLVRIDETDRIQYRADGIIVSTSTGSTAYSAAAGGPILHPEMEALILNPICPFTLSHRPLVLPPSVEIEVEVADDQRTALGLTIDGQLSHELAPGDKVRIRRASKPVYILYSGKRSFFDVLRAKLNWSGTPE